LTKLNILVGLFLLSNTNKNVFDIINIYRSKDFVEQAFERIKERLNFRRIRVHNIKSAENKFLIVFMALIILSHIDRVMSEKHIYGKYTMKKIFRKLESFFIHRINDKIFYNVLNHELKEIFKIFDLPLPPSLCRVKNRWGIQLKSQFCP
jgi:transposase